MKKESLGYALFVDQDMDELFTIFCKLYDSFDKFNKVDRPNETDEMILRVRKSFQDFLRKIIPATHEMGWCSDPECEYEDYKKNNKK